MVDRKSSGPLRPWRRLRARRTASLRVSGWMARRSDASSSRVACMKSISSGRGLRSDRARASVPRSATSRRRISSSSSRRSRSRRALNSSRARRSSSGVSVPLGRRGARRLHQPLEDPVEVEVPQRAVQVVGAAHGAARLHAREPAHGLAGQRGDLGVVGRRAAPGTASRPAPRAKPLAAAAALAPALARGPGRRARRRSRGRRAERLVVTDLVLGAPHREVDLEGRLERLPVGRGLHQAWRPART